MMALNCQHYQRSTQQELPDLTNAHLAVPQRSHGKETQLRFNLDVTTHPANLAVQFSNPSPITIEKISAPQNKSSENVVAENFLRNSISPLSFSAASVQRLNLALQLAKRDMKLKHFGKKLELKSKSLPCHQGSPKSKTRNLLNNPEKVKTKPHVKSSIKHEVTDSGAWVYVYTPDQNRINMGVSDSPPTHDPGPGDSPKKALDPSEQEIKRLQRELHTYMQKIEELAKKERYGEVLDPSEEARGRIRQQQRASRSARMLYVLQQQVKEIHEDLEKLSPQKIKHTKKSRTMSRLAAVHRGAIRALQIFITQLSERGEQQIPSLYKELGHLIRQLSLCTAKLESGDDPASSSMIISILQLVEDLDTLLDHKISSRAKKTSPNTAASRSPPILKDSSNTRSAVREDQCIQPVYMQTEPLEESWTHVSRQLVLDNPPESVIGAAHAEPKPSSPERKAALRAGLEALIQAGHLKGLPRKESGQNKNKGVLIPHRPKGFRQPRKINPTQPAHFQEKTVAFKLKENHPIVRERKIPWVPPNPTSPPASPKRGNWDRERHRSNISPSRKWDPSDALNSKETEKEGGVTHQDFREEAHEINRLPDELYESDNVPAQQVENYVDYLSGDSRVGSLQEVTQFPGNEDSHVFQQGDNLEAMIQRMEEIEKYQEAVRQRFTRIAYADPEFWAHEERERTHATTGQILQSPHPIRITKPTGQREPVVSILLEEPFEGDSLQIKEELVRTSPHYFIQHSSTKGHVRVSVPQQMLQSIHSYTEKWNRHLRLTSHEEVGGFNPWQISERLADELIDDALGDVAAELQDLCEGYAEAVFTSEFMEPTKNY
ncbi:protein moonraker isoform X2 [Pseudophryne corroboree]